MAAAQIAIQALLDLLYCGLLALQVALLDGCVGGCDKSRRARSTLQRVVAAVRLCRQTSVSLTQDYLIIVEATQSTGVHPKPAPSATQLYMQSNLFNKARLFEEVSLHISLESPDLIEMRVKNR